MKILLSVLCLLLLTSCGPSQEELRQAEMEQQQAEMEKQRLEKEASVKLAQEMATRTAAVTCAVMAETRNMDASVRVEKINDAREKIGGEPFLSGDDAIKEAFEFGLCQALVLNENYDERLQELKDAKDERERRAAERRAEEARIVAEKRANEEKIAAEKRRIAAEKRAEEERIAATKPTVNEEFYSNGRLKSRSNYQSKNDGGKQHGLSRAWHENGQLRSEDTFKNGKQEGLSQFWDENGQLRSKNTQKNGEPHGLSQFWDENGQLVFEQCFVNGGLSDKSNCLE